MGTTGFMVLLFLVVITVGLFFALWMSYQSAEQTRELESEAAADAAPRRRSGIFAPFGTPRSRADVVQRLERHIESESRMVAAFGSGPSVDRLHGLADDTPVEGGVDVAEAKTP